MNRAMTFQSRWFQSPRHCKHGHLSKTGLPQSQDAFIYGGTCCEHIIQQQDSFRSQIHRQTYLKRALQIDKSLLPFQGCLRQRIDTAFQSVITNWNIRKYGLGQPYTLVIASLTQPFYMKRHRQNHIHIQILQIFKQIRPGQTTHGTQGITIVYVFDFVQQFPHRTFK